MSFMDNLKKVGRQVVDTGSKTMLKVGVPRLMLNSRSITIESLETVVIFFEKLIA